MRKILLICLLSYLFSNNLSANESKKLLFNRWLNINGYEKYLDKTSDPVDIVLDRSLCKPKVTWECVGADGNIILGKDRKSTPIYPNNLNIKLNKKKIILVINQILIEIL